MFEFVHLAVRSLFGKKKGSGALRKTPVVLSKKTHGIDPKLVSWQARKTCENLQAHGFKAYIVGGAVRDLLLGVRPKDFDVATNATPEQVRRTQRRSFIIGRRFRLVHVVFGAEVIECSTFRALNARGVQKDNSGRVISDNVFGSMWEDAARRDFTINALYYDPTTEEVFDYHDGFKDLKRRCLRMIGNPLERYREDPVRMMRAIRIASKLHFKIEEKTLKPISSMARLIENVPAARLFDEMMKLFTSGAAVECIQAMRKNNLHRSLLPLLDVVCRESEGEEFLMLALKRTDERISIGKKISPSFLFCTLLWPQVKRRWDENMTKPRAQRAPALLAAAETVIATQCERLAIQNRFVADMKVIWLMQLRFERRTGKYPYNLVAQPKYRAAYDFMLLRSLLGHVDKTLVAWWDAFAVANDEKRAEMVAACELEARKTGESARRGRRVAKNAEAAESMIEKVNASRKPHRRRHRQAKPTSDIPS